MTGGVLALASAVLWGFSGVLVKEATSRFGALYVGAIGIGRIQRGTARPGQAITLVANQTEQRSGKILEVLGFSGLKREARESAAAGALIAVTGIDGLRISDTLSDHAAVEPSPALVVG